jgi:hypothetical protein
VDSLTVNIDGRSTIIERKKLPLEELVLDIENPRLRYHLDTRLNDSDVTQEKLEFALVESNDQYEKLRAHIEFGSHLNRPHTWSSKGTRALTSTRNSLRSIRMIRNGRESIHLSFLKM